jgi:hypothetical protein
MAIHSPKPTAYPSIPTATWTKVNTVPGGSRKYLLIANTDTTNIYRFLKLLKPNGMTDVAWATAVNVAYGATSGLPLAPAPSAGLAGGYYEENYQNLSSGDIWAYQASGGDLATLSVTEGV